MSQPVTLKAKIETARDLRASIEISGAKGDKGDQGLSGDQPQAWATVATTIPASHYWVKPSPRLALGETIVIGLDAKLLTL